MSKRLKEIILWAFAFMLVLSLGYMIGTWHSMNEVDKMVMERRDEYTTAELGRVSELFRKCETDVSFERAKKLDALDDLRRTQIDRDRKYTDLLECANNLFVAEQERDEFRRCPATLNECNDTLMMCNLNKGFWERESAFWKAEWQWCDDPTVASE